MYVCSNIGLVFDLFFYVYVFIWGGVNKVSQQFRLPMRFVRKSLAVGAIFCGEEDMATPLYLDELALEVRERLNMRNLGVPFCCFNGGLDVFIDIGR